MRCFIYNYIDSSKTSKTVVFNCARHGESKIEEDLKLFHTYQEQCFHTIYIYPRDERSSTEVSAEIAQISNKDVNNITVIPFTSKGVPLSGEVEEILFHGIATIIRRRNGILESDDNFHYVLPSQKHSPFFIRTGNILVKSSEINFLALALMSKVDVVQYSFIVCDTSSIISLPYAVNSLLGLFEERINAPFLSFGSYNSIDEFEFKPNTLVLISASNSGDLEKKIRRRQKDITVTTILYNNEIENKSSLINIASILKSLLKNKNYKQFPSMVGCEYCDRNSIPVVVNGEQFIPSRMLVRRVLFSKQQVPNWMAKIGPAILEKKAIWVSRRETVTSKRREIFFNIAGLIDKKDRFIKELSTYIDNHIPVAIDQIIYVKDQGSRKVAELIQNKFINLGHKMPAIRAHTEISEIKQLNPKNILVVAACTTSGNKLNSISRDLRNFDHSSLHYLSVIARLENEFKMSTLRQNIEYRSKDKKYAIHLFHSVFTCFLGDYHDKLFTYFEKSPWENERQFWQRQASRPHEIETRMALLEESDGLIDELFFNNPFPEETGRLYLRKNFAFYDFTSDRNESQADIYFVISSIFHNVRHPDRLLNSSESEKYKLVQHEHLKSILDPECFKRYNDGIIQACLLRCARPSELDYTASEKDSREMLETLKDIFKPESSAQTKEAILEFLYAIATGKLQLIKSHSDEFLGMIQETYNTIAIINYFLSLCHTKIH